MAGIVDYWNQGTDLVQRNMKQVGPAMKEVFGERIYPERLSGPAAKAAASSSGVTARGLLGKAVSAPAQLGLTAATLGGDSGDPEVAAYRELGPEAYASRRWAMENPEAAQAGMQYGQDVADRAVGSGMQYAANMTNPQDSVTVQQPEAAPEQAQVDPEKQEVFRQHVEKKVYEAVDKQKISRPEIAKAVVKADQVRSGTELSPKEEEKAVKEETSFLRSMDKAEVSKYLSYALIAGGLYAGFADESGRSGDIFVNSYDKERSRQAAKKMREEDQAIAAAKAAQEQANKERELGQGDARLEVAKGKAKSLEDYQNASLSLTAAAEKRKAAGQGARLSLEEQRIAQQMSSDAVRNGLLAEKNRILAAKAAKTNGPKGLDLSNKDATTQVKEWAKSQSVPIDDATAQAVGTQLQYVLKNNPTQFATDPSGTINGLLKANRTTKEPGMIRGLFGADPSKAYAAPGLVQ